MSVELGNNVGLPQFDLKAGFGQAAYQIGGTASQILAKGEQVLFVTPPALPSLQNSELSSAEQQAPKKGLVTNGRYFST